MYSKAQRFTYSPALQINAHWFDPLQVFQTRLKTEEQNSPIPLPYLIIPVTFETALVFFFFNLFYSMPLHNNDIENI